MLKHNIYLLTFLFYRLKKEDKIVVAKIESLHYMKSKYKRKSFLINILKNRAEKIRETRGSQMVNQGKRLGIIHYLKLKKIFPAINMCGLLLIFL